MPDDYRDWSDWFERQMQDPEFAAGVAAERARLDAAWEVECREGCCLWWVLPEGDVGGIGVPGCPCARND